MRKVEVLQEVQSTRTSCRSVGGHMPDLRRKHDHQARACVVRSMSTLLRSDLPSGYTCRF